MIGPEFNLEFALYNLPFCWISQADSLIDPKTIYLFEGFLTLEGDARKGKFSMHIEKLRFFFWESTLIYLKRENIFSLP